MQKYDTIIFDLDGTLLDTLPDLTDAVNYAMTQLCFPIRSIDEVLGFVGNGIRKTIERSVPPNVSQEQIEQALTFFREYYFSHLTVKTKPFGGIMELLRTLHGRGIKMGIASNKADFAVQQLNNHFFSGFGMIALGESPTIPRKPAPDMVAQLCQRLNSKNVLYVGDSDTDVQTAINAGLDQISVLWGYRSQQQLEQAGAERFIEKPSEIFDIL